MRTVVLRAETLAGLGYRTRRAGAGQVRRPQGQVSSVQFSSVRPPIRRMMDHDCASLLLLLFAVVVAVSESGEGRGGTTREHGD